MRIIIMSVVMFLYANKALSKRKMFENTVVNFCN